MEGASPSSRTTARSGPGATNPVQDTVMTCVTSAASNPWARCRARPATRGKSAIASRAYTALRSAVPGLRNAPLAAST